ncbi:hypothetical protein ACRALDRAFT_211730 [Sodiomyces alcalophilus JCM 7366]|uniref:uncharacterized protein n=1 Tax=Sodiomyces alcalophilus JCM 7366 TaxID=591952 RepID=UPI0039B455FA
MYLQHHGYWHFRHPRRQVHRHTDTDVASSGTGKILQAAALQMQSMTQGITIEQRRAYHADAEKFLDWPGTTREDLDDGRNYHRARVTINPVPHTWIAPDEIEERVNLARTVQNAIRTARGWPEDNPFKETLHSFRLNLIQFSLFLCGDLEDLRLLSQHNYQNSYNFLITIEAIVASCACISFHYPPSATLTATVARASQGDVIQRGETEAPPAALRERADSDNDGNDGGGPSHQPRARADGSACRNADEAQAARERDGGLCLVSKNIEPDMCHIWPFAATSTAARCQNLRENLQWFLLYNATMGARLLDILTPQSGEIAKPDNRKNIVALSPTIHRFWGKFLYGFKPLDSPPAKLVPVPASRAKKRKSADDPIEYCEFYAEWHWLPDRLHDALKDAQLVRPDGETRDFRMVLDFQKEEVVQSVKRSLRESYHRPNLVSTSGATVRDQNGRLMQSGRLVTFKTETKDLDDMKFLLKAQWLAIQLARMSGAADVPDLLDPKRPRGAPPKSKMKARARVMGKSLVRLASRPKLRDESPESPGELKEASSSTTRKASSSLKWMPSLTKQTPVTSFHSSNNFNRSWNPCFETRSDDIVTPSRDMADQCGPDAGCGAGNKPDEGSHDSKTGTGLDNFCECNAKSKEAMKMSAGWLLMGEKQMMED